MCARPPSLVWMLGCCLIGATTAGGCTPGPIEVATLTTGSLADELVAHWALDENGGTVANDSSGNGRTGFMAGPGWSWVPGQFKSALHFSGADFLTVSGIPPAPSSYSVSAWVLIAPNELGPPLANLLSTEAPGGGWALYARLGPGQQSFVFHYPTSATQSYETVSCACVVPGAWTHLTAVVDGDAATLTLYVGGTATMVPTNGASILPGSTVLFMARSAALTPIFPLAGALDDIAIYGRALAAEEVAQLSQMPAPKPR